MSSQGPTPEFAQAFCVMMLEGLNTEVETTKKVLAAVPNDKRDYRPDSNARTAGELAWHIAETDVQFLDAIADMDFNKMAPVAEADRPKTIAEVVEWYDRNMKRAMARVAAMSGQQLATPVNFMGIFNLPAFAYLGFLNNHSIHHRGQLATYLRPMGSKCPSIYGGSYDEPFQMPEADTTAA
jgi:uncharacterized damage-inducible protein DinB